jgi:hypothetical protein
MLHENTDIRPTRYHNDRNGTLAAAVSAFEIANRMRKQSWANIESVLEIFLHEIAKDKTGWKWK